MAVLDMKAPGYGMVLGVQSARTLPALHEPTADEIQARIGVTLWRRCGDKLIVGLAFIGLAFRWVLGRPGCRGGCDGGIRCHRGRRGSGW